MTEINDPDLTPDAPTDESVTATPLTHKTRFSAVAAVISLFAGLIAAMVVFFLTMLITCAGIIPATDYPIRLGLVIGCSVFPAIVAGAVAIRIVSRHLESLRNLDQP